TSAMAAPIGSGTISGGASIGATKALGCGDVGCGARAAGAGGGGGGGGATAGISATNARTSGTAGSSRDATRNDISAMTARAVPWMLVDTRIGMAGVLGTCCTFPVIKSNMASSTMTFLHGNGRAAAEDALRAKSLVFEVASVHPSRVRGKNHVRVRTLRCRPRLAAVRTVPSSSASWDEALHPRVERRA